MLVFNALSSLLEWVGVLRVCGNCQYRMCGEGVNRTCSVVGGGYTRHLDTPHARPLFFQDRLHVSISHLRGSAWIGPGMDADVAVEVAEGRGVSSWCYGVWWSIGTEVIISSGEDQISMEAPHDIVQKKVTMHFKFERMEKNVVYLRKWYDTMDWRVAVNQCLLKLNKVSSLNKNVMFWT